MYKIQVKKKRVKNITIRVKSESLVTITAPTYVSDEYLNKLTKEKAKWIEDRIATIKNRNGNKEGTLNYLGKSYKINVIQCEEEKVTLANDEIYVGVRNLEDKKRINYIIKEWYYSEAKHIFETLIKRYEGITGKSVSALRIRPMKTRWGSCNTVKGYINLNLILIEKPIECIEYVVLHELAHLTHPNHSKDFWDYVESYMGDFKERRQRLK